MNTAAAWLVEGTFVAVAAVAAMRMVPRSSAAVRHLLLWLTLLVVAAWPLVVADRPAGSPSVQEIRAVAAVPDASAAERSSGVGVSLHLPALPPAMVRTLVVLWALTVVWSLLRLGIDFRRLRHVARTATPVDERLEAAMPHWQAAREAGRPIRLSVSPEIDGACAAGFWRPSILISNELRTTLDVASLEAIVLHEHAHLRRGDDWSRLLQLTILALAGIHPAVRWLSWLIDDEREAACDQEVVARTGAPLPYAKALAQVATSVVKPTGHRLLAPAAILSHSSLRRRVERLLDGRPVSRLRLSSASTAGAAIPVLATLVAAELPPVIIFADGLVPMAVRESIAPTNSVATRSVTDSSRSLPSEAPPAAAGVDRLSLPRAAERVPAIARAAADVVASALPHDDSRSPQNEIAPRLDPQPVDTPIVGWQEPVSPQGAPIASVEPPLVATVVDSAPSPLPARAAGTSLPDASLPDDRDWLAQPFIDTGTRVARVSVVTSDAVSKAGQSIGRFFKQSSLSIGRQF